MTAALAAAGLGLAALLGSIPFGLLLARAATGGDVRHVGSGNIGATNVLRASGVAPAVATLLLDVGKGAAAVLAMRALASCAEESGDVRHALQDWAGFAAVTGHVFSPWVGFRGGKGVATALGALAVLSPALAVVGAAAFSASIVATRIVSLSSIAASLAVTGAAIWRSVAAHGAGTSPSLLVLLGICALIVARHAANIGRLLRGEEPAIGARSAGGKGPP